MAVWQFDFNVVPKEKSFIAEKICSEDILSWKQENISSLEINFLEKPLYKYNVEVYPEFVSGTQMSRF